MRTRIISGTIGAIIVLFLLTLPQPAPGILIFLAWIICSYEFMLMVRAPIPCLIGLILSLLLFSTINFLRKTRWSEVFSYPIDTLPPLALTSLLILIQVIVSIIALTSFKVRLKRLPAITVILIQIFLITWPFASITFLAQTDENRLILVFVLLLTWVGDVSALFAGRTFGNLHITPRLSPGKTLEGLIGSVVGSCVYLFTLGTTYILNPPLERHVMHNPLARIFPNDWLPLVLYSLFFGVLFALAGFFGDITVSAVKRIYSRKDTGTFLPGHGGFYDRIDSLLFIAPLFFLLYSLSEAYALFI